MSMGVAKAWRFSLISANLALLQEENGGNNIGSNKHYLLWRWRSNVSQRRKIPWSLICGLMLFALGLISLFTGHVASDLEWYSQRLVKRSLYNRLVTCFSSEYDCVSLFLELEYFKLQPLSVSYLHICGYVEGWKSAGVNRYLEIQILEVLLWVQ